MLLMMVSCYSRKEACLDAWAANFDVTADDECSTCCTYPYIKLKISHMFGDSIFNASDTLQNDRGQSYIIQDVRYYLSSFFLYQGDSTYRVREKIATADNGLVIPDDMKIFRNRDTEFNIGTVKAFGRFDSLSFSLGLTSDMTQSTFVGLNNTHVLLPNNKLKDANDETAHFVLRYRRIGATDSLYHTISITTRPDFPALTRDTIINTTKGKEISFPIKADYQVLLANLDLNVGPDSLSKLVLDNIKKMIVVK